MSKAIPSYAAKDNFQYDTFAVITLIHLIALAAPFTFSWPGLITFAVMSFVTGGIGITLAYHRLLTHGSFKTNRVVKYFMTFIACLALQGGPIYWVATHRLHHKESDKEFDPHTPMVSFMWAHLWWNFFTHPQLKNEADYRKFAPDLYEDSGIVFLQKYFFVIYLAFAGLLYAVGNHFGGTQLGLSLVVWGVCLRTVYTWHVTWLVNSATHMWGYRNYESKDTSRNNWLVALLTFGEGWHNNHHADQSSAHFGHRWWEFDQSYVILKALKMVGLVHSVNQPRFKRMASLQPANSQTKVKLRSAQNAG